MKRAILSFFTILLITLSVGAAHARAAEDAVVLAVNQPIAYVGDTSKTVTAPMLVMDKTYVNLYEIAPLLGADVAWVEEGGYFIVTANGTEVCFELIRQYDELNDQSYRFFVRDGNIMVSLRELADLTQTPLAYDRGIITLGHTGANVRSYYKTLELSPLSDYVYFTYPPTAEYVVNSLQEYSYETMLEDAAQLEQMYPDLIRTGSIGQSVEGRELLLLEFGRGEKKVFVCGTHHAREYIATTYLMYAIDRYAYAYRNHISWNGYDLNSILSQVTFCIVPMVNPDGVNLVQNGVYATTNAEALLNMGIYEGKRYGYEAWKANIRGVDVNWNYDKDWFYERNKNGRGSTGFNGDAPNTEPETQAVAAYVDQNPFLAYLSFHTQGEIFYYADDPENPMNLYSLIHTDTGFVGYEEQATGRGGSFFDYVYRKFLKPTLTVELCPYIGNFPYPNEDFYTVWTPAQNVLAVIGNAALYR